MPNPRDGHPNVVVLHCHDLGKFLSVYGVDTVRTPALEALAQSAVTFDRAFCTAPQCSPSRAALFTGRWPHSNGVLGLTSLDFAWDLHPEEMHLAEVLHRNGYATKLLGVHHESRVKADQDVARQLGFDEVRRGGDARTVSDRAIGALQEFAEQGGPFYLQVGFIEPHRQTGPRDAPDISGFLGRDIEPDHSLGVTVPGYVRDDEAARVEIAELQGAIHRMDEQAGRVLDALDRLGLVDNTITVFTTDHGLALPRAKCTLYDPGLEVSLMIRYPRAGWIGGRRGTLTSNVDLVPTVLDLAGVPIPGSVQGQSLAQSEDAQDRRHIFAEMTYHDYYDPRRAIRTRRHKLIVNFSSAPDIMDPSGAWRRRCTPVVDTRGPSRFHPVVEMYDLQLDPLELHDISNDADSAHLRTALLYELASWMRETADPLLDGAVMSPLHERAVSTLRAVLSAPDVS